MYVFVPVCMRACVFNKHSNPITLNKCMYVLVWINKPANRLVIGKSHLIRWQHFHNFFFFCRLCIFIFSRLFFTYTYNRRQDMPENICQLEARFIAMVIYKSFLCQQMHTLFAFIACGTNFNRWIFVYVCLWLLHVTHKITSTIH